MMIYMYYAIVLYMYVRHVYDIFVQYITLRFPLSCCLHFSHVVFGLERSNRPLYSIWVANMIVDTNVYIYSEQILHVPNG